MKKTFICINCKKEHLANPRLKEKQAYCSDDVCQKARKAAWKREKIKKDREYRENRNIENEQWRNENSTYWQNYRKNNPEGTKRNRLLQAIRNKKRRQFLSHRNNREKFAKVDTFPLNFQSLQYCNEFFLVPLIAKVDALRVKLAVIAEHSS